MYDTNNWVDIMKMRYSIELKYRTYVEQYGFLSFARKVGNKYGKKLMDTATKTGIDAAKTAETTGDLIGNKIADKITSASTTKIKGKEDETNKRQEIYIPLKKKTTNNRFKVVLDIV